MMKSFYLPILLIILLHDCLIILGQPSDTIANKTNCNYVSFCALTGSSFLFSNNKNGALSISFPYTVTSTGGARSDSIFNSKSIQPYKQLKAFVFPLYLEVGSLRNFYTAQFFVSIIGAASGYNYTLGYGRNFYFNKHFYAKKNISDNSFVIKTFMRIAYTNYRGYDEGSPFYLGNIDNENKYINVLGNVAAPTYTTSGKSPQTYEAKTLDIIYSQNEWALAPGISISSNPYKHYFFWQVEMGYNFVLHEKGGIILLQNNFNKIKTLDLSESRIKVSYNNTLIKSAPYIVDGFYAGVKAGFSIRSKSFRNHH